MVNIKINFNMKIPGFYESLEKKIIIYNSKESEKYEEALPVFEPSKS